MKSIARIIGYILWIGSGLLMLGFWFSAMVDWLGIFGYILAIFLSPGIVIFPIVFWIVEGVFPTFYFLVWGIGIVGMIIGGLASDDR